MLRRLCVEERIEQHHYLLIDEGTHWANCKTHVRSYLDCLQVLFCAFQVQFTKFTSQNNSEATQQPHTTSSPHSKPVPFFSIILYIINADSSLSPSINPSKPSNNLSASNPAKHLIPLSHSLFAFPHFHPQSPRRTLAFTFLRGLSS